MKVAIVHDLLTQMGGAERVVDVFHDMFPDAPIFTAALNDQRISKNLKDADIRTTWMQKIPGIETNFKKMLPLYPMAIRDIDTREFDVVISSSFAFVKGIRVPENTFHLCYCHTPMRFAWDFESYIAREPLSSLTKHTLKTYVKYLRYWDKKTANRVDQYVANSTIVKKRIETCYQRQADIIFPPVNTSRFQISHNIGDYYLIVSRLVSYKRIDLAVQAFNQLGIPLYIVGDGPDLPRLMDMAKENVKFLGRLPDEDINTLMAQCRGFIFPGEEDFGITPLEANAAGRPVIAYQAGGALDTVDPYTSGLYFAKQEPEYLAAAIREAETQSWNAEAIRRHAMKFDEETFKQKFNEYLDNALINFRMRKEVSV